jgi:hypothetical protein
MVGTCGAIALMAVALLARRRRTAPLLSEGPTTKWDTRAPCASRPGEQAGAHRQRDLVHKFATASRDDGRSEDATVADIAEPEPRTSDQLHESPRFGFCDRTIDLSHWQERDGLERGGTYARGGAAVLDAFTPDRDPQPPGFSTLVPAGETISQPPPKHWSPSPLMPPACVSPA